MAGRKKADPDERMLKILMIDDDREELMLVREMIDAAGGDIVHVEWVSGAAQALTLLGIDDFGLFLVDRNLGGERGADFIQRARDAGITTPAVFYTGAKREDLDEKSLALMAQGVGYICKSTVQPDELLAAFRDFAIHTMKVLEVFLDLDTAPGVPERIGKFSLNKRLCMDMESAKTAAEESLWDLVICHVPDLSRRHLHDLLRLKAGYGLSPLLLRCHQDQHELPMELEMMRQSGDLIVVTGSRPSAEAVIDAIQDLRE